MMTTKNGAAVLAAIALTATASAHLAAQRPEAGSAAEGYAVVNSDAVALTGVTLIDGRGGPARRGRTVVIEGSRITIVGADGAVDIPAGAEVMDLAGHTVIPGMIGLHNHLFYTAAGGRSAQLTFSAPRLYLGSGVTTVRTTGSRQPYAELNLKAEIEAGRTPGPRIHITAPYITAGGGMSGMTMLESPEQARRFVRYWAAEGATWLKAYTNIRTEELTAAIDEAHAQGIKVTGHLCSISFTEAVALGIDNIEHGLATNSDYSTGRGRDECPQSLWDDATSIDVNGPEAQATFQAMIDAGVAMTSTLAVYELFIQGRPTRDARSLEAMAPAVREDYLAAKAQIDEIGPLPGGVPDRDGLREGVLRCRRCAGLGRGPDRERRRTARLRRPAQLRAAVRSRVRTPRGDRDPERERGPGAGSLRRSGNRRSREDRRPSRNER